MSLWATICRLLVLLARIFALVSLGAQISAPKDGPKGLLRLRVPPVLWLTNIGDKDE